MTRSPTRKLLWRSLSRIAYLNVPGWVEESLRAEFPEIDIVIGRTEEMISREAAECEIFVSWTLDAQQFSLFRKLKWIHSPSTGVTELLSPAVIASDVIVTNGRTVHAVPVAEHAIALLFALSRNLGECFRYQAEGVWGHVPMWQGRIPSELNGTTVGVVGLGSIGREIAARVRALGMRVLGVKRDPTRGAESADQIYSPQQLPEILGALDYLILAVPETAGTRGLIGEQQLRRMKPSACIVNIARGSLIDTDALIRALDGGMIAGAALDVTDPEPLPPQHRLWRTPHVLITHHMAAATERFWPRQLDLLKANLRRYLAGEPLLNPVDKKEGY